jgi:hypothetical protein
VFWGVESSKKLSRWFKYNLMLSQNQLTDQAEYEEGTSPLFVDVVLV